MKKFSADYPKLHIQFCLKILPLLLFFQTELVAQNPCDTDTETPIARCRVKTTIANLGGDGMAFVTAANLDSLSFDNCKIVSIKTRRTDESPCDGDDLPEIFEDRLTVCCSDRDQLIGYELLVVDSTGNSSICTAKIQVADKRKPICFAPANDSILCQNFDPNLAVFGVPTITDNCQVEGWTEESDLSKFDTACRKGLIFRHFTVVDASGNTNRCTQRLWVVHENNYFIRFPNDTIVDVFQFGKDYGQPKFLHVDCEKIEVKFEDQVYNSIPQPFAGKAERTFTIKNLCNFDPLQGCSYIPHPNDYPAFPPFAPENLAGTVYSLPGTKGWEPTKHFVSLWNPQINCFVYRQIIYFQKTSDAQQPQNQPEKLNFYPNPSAGEVNFELPESFENGQLRLSDSRGRAVATAVFSGQNFKFEKSGLPPGIYFFQILTAKRAVFSGKILFE